MFTFPETDQPSSAGAATRRLPRALLFAGLTLPLALVTFSRMASDQTPPSASAEISASTTPLSRALATTRYGLSAADLVRYRRMFDSLDRSNWKTNDDAGLADRRLVGHVLATRYLAADARPTFAELRSWLDLYGDLPEAAEIYDQAKSALPADYTSALPAPREQASDQIAADPDKSGTAEPHSDPGERAFSRFFAGDDKGALVDATRAISMLGERATNSLWIAGLAAWRLGKLPEAQQHFTALAASPAASGKLLAAGAYWAGRVEQQQGLVATAMKWFNKASRYPTTFYGMLATRKLGLNLGDGISGASLTAEHLNTLAEIPAGYRAVALLQLGRRDLAARELERIDPAGNPRVAEALIVVADAAHLGEISPILARRIARPADGGSDQHFPIPSWKPRGGFRVDPALVYAVARQESGFDPNAVSAAGAAGLMQIMPDTADAVSPNRQNSLLDPSTNLDVGQRYLRALMHDPNIGQNLLLLAVAYSHGASNPAKFQHMLEVEDPLLALESIPKDDTRAYIQNVLTNYWIYSARLGDDTSSLTELADGRWPIYHWNESGHKAVQPDGFPN